MRVVADRDPEFARRGQERQQFHLVAWSGPAVVPRLGLELLDAGMMRTVDVLEPVAGNVRPSAGLEPLDGQRGQFSTLDRLTLILSSLLANALSMRADRSSRLTTWSTPLPSR